MRSKRCWETIEPRADELVRAEFAVLLAGMLLASTVALLGVFS